MVSVAHMLQRQLDDTDITTGVPNLLNAMQKPLSVRKYLIRSKKAKTVLSPGLPQATLRIGIIKKFV